MGRGDLTVPVVEGWTALAMAAGATTRISLGSFVLNVVNRHPAVVARMASTLQIASGGRLILGIGIGGHPKEHAAYGIEFPPPPERVARLEEAVAVIRALWTGGPVTRESPYYPLVEAYARPVPDPAPPIIIGGETPAGARLAARIGDGWTSFEERFVATCPCTSRRSRRPASGARTRPCTWASRASGCPTRRWRTRPGCESPRDLGAVAIGRRRRRDRAGADDGRRGPAGGRRRALVGREQPRGPSAGPDPAERPPTERYGRSGPLEQAVTGIRAGLNSVG